MTTNRTAYVVITGQGGYSPPKSTTEGIMVNKITIGNSTLQAYANLLKVNMDALKKRDKRAKTQKTKATHQK